MKRTKPEERARLLKAYRAFDGTQREFCTANDIPLSRLQSWLYKKQVASAPRGFVELRAEQAVVNSSGTAVHLGNVRVEFASPPSAEYLVELARAFG